MNDQPELLALVTQAQAGDLEAFESLVHRFQDMAVGYAYSVLNDFAQAQDDAQRRGRMVSGG